MSVADLVHKTFVLGLAGVTLYYGAFVVIQSGDVIARYRAQNAAKDSAPKAFSGPNISDDSSENNKQ
eukprot:gene381-3730_t